MSRKIEIVLEPFIIYDKEIPWSRFRDILHYTIAQLRPEDCLESDIISLLVKRVDSLITNILRVAYHVNNKYLERGTLHLIELLDEGVEMYNSLLTIVEKSVYTACTREYPAEVFIRTLLGVKKCLPDVIMLVNDIRSWTKDVSSEIYS